MEVISLNLSELATVIATVAAAVTAIFAFLFTKELNKPILSLVKSDITMELEWNFLDVKFEFENVGNESLKIIKFIVGLYDSKTKQFDYIEKPPAVNTYPAKQKFTYRHKFELNKELAKKIRLYMEENFPEGQVYDQHPKVEGIRKLFGKSIIIFSIEYQGTSLFSYKKIPLKHFIVYEGARKYELPLDEYNEIKESIPEMFTIK